MDRATFRNLLDAAAKTTVEFARGFVIQQLPEKIAFYVYPNQSYDGNPLVGDEQLFPEDRLPGGKFHGPWTAEQVVEFLWRDGRAPEWIDTSVDHANETVTVISLRCCGRFSTGHYYYGSQEQPSPFGLKGPPLPPGWQSVEKSGKFDLNWSKAAS